MNDRTKTVVDGQDTVVPTNAAIEVVSDKVIAKGKFVEDERGNITYIQTADDRGENDQPAN